MGNLMSKHRGWNKDSPIYDAGFVVGGEGFCNSSPSTNPESSEAPSDPMQPAIDSVEEMLKRDFGDRYNPKA